MASKYLVRPELLDALIQAESGWNPNAVSNKGAQGLAQVMPSTGKNPGFGVKPLSSNDPREHMRFANDYLGALLDKFNGNEALAVAAYNAGPGAVSKHGGIPPYQETVNYVGKIGSMLNPIGEAQAETQPSGNGVMAQESKPNSLNNAEAAWEKYQASIKKPSLNPAEAAWERYQSSIQQSKPEAPKQSGIQSAIVDMGKALEPSIDFVQGLRGSGLKSLQGISSFFGDNQVSDFFKGEAKDMTDASQSTAGSVGRFAGDVAPFLIIPQMKVAEGAGYLGHAIPEVANLLSNAQLAQMLTPGSDEERNKAFADAGIGGAIGATAAPVLGGVIKGFTPSKGAQALMDEGVQPTLGQGIEQNILGKGVRWLEEGLGSLPGFGWASKYARSRAQNEGLDYLLKQGELSLPTIPGKAPGIDITTGGNVGHDAIKSLKNSAKSAYDSLLNGTQVSTPASTLDNIKTIIDDPKYSITDLEKKSLKQFIDSHIDVLKQNNSANTYKQIINDLWKESNSYAGPLASSSDRIKANALRNVASQIKTQLHNGIGPEKSAYLQQIDESFGKIQTLKSAASSAKAAKDGGNFSPSDLMREIRKADKTMRKDAFSMGEARMQKEAARVHNVLGDTLPNSGTTDRAIASAALTGALWPVMDKVLLGAGVGFAGASRPVQKALLGGYQGQQQLGDLINQYMNRVGSGIGANQSQ